MGNYEQGKQIKSVSDFAESKKKLFIVHYGATVKTTHRGFMMSWQYHFLEAMINRGWVYEAERVDKQASGD